MTITAARKRLVEIRELIKTLQQESQELKLVIKKKGGDLQPERTKIKRRNAAIVRQLQAGTSVPIMAIKYNLHEGTIRMIWHRHLARERHRNKLS